MDQSLIEQVMRVGCSRTDAEEALLNAEGDVRSAQFLVLGTKSGGLRKIDTLVLLGFDREDCERAFFAANRNIKEAARALLRASDEPSYETQEVRGLTLANAKNVLQHYAVTHCIALPRYERSASALGPFSASVTIGDHEIKSSGIHRRAVDAELSAAYNACVMLAKTSRDFVIPDKLARW